MVFILNCSKMDSHPDNIQNSMISLRGDYGTFSVQNFHKLVLFIFQHLNGIQYLGREIMAPSTSRTSIYVGFDYFPTEFFFNFNWHSISFFHTHTIQVKWTLKWTWNVSRGVFTYCHIYGLLGLPIRIFSYWVMCTFAYHILGLCVHFTYHVNIFHNNIIIFIFSQLESLLRYEVLLD